VPVIVASRCRKPLTVGLLIQISYRVAPGSDCQEICGRGVIWRSTIGSGVTAVLITNVCGADQRDFTPAAFCDRTQTRNLPMPRSDVGV
jgi:hypothetical protein